MSIDTGRGDDGMTDLMGKQRVDKANIRIEACGCVDELNAALGRVMASDEDSDLRELLDKVQRILFCLGSDLANAEWPVEKPYFDRSSVARLESWIAHFDRDLPRLKNFILPGGTPSAANLHWARTVCRRVERRVVALAATEPINDAAIPFLNRLGDLLFVLARQANVRAGVDEVIWKPDRKKS